MTHSLQPEAARNSRSGAPVLICFAVREEGRCFTPPVTPLTDVLITGIGARRAAAAVEGYLAAHRPRLVLTCGFAGGLDPALPLGRVVIDDSHAGRFLEGITLPGVQRGRFIHSNRVVVTAAEKARLRGQTGGDAVEMESSVITGICRDRGVPVGVVRVISDTAMEDLPLDFNRFSRPDGSLSMPRLLAGLARSPSSVPRLLAFQRRLRVAAEALSGALACCLEQLD